MTSIPAHVSQICCATQRVGMWILRFPFFRASHLVAFRNHKTNMTTFNTLHCAFRHHSIVFVWGFSSRDATVLVPSPGFSTEALRQRDAYNTNDSKTVTIDKFCKTTSQSCRDFALTNRPHPLQILMDSQTLARDWLYWSLCSITFGTCTPEEDANARIALN